MISRLEQKGLVSVLGDKNDKRIKYVNNWAWHQILWGCQTGRYSLVFAFLLSVILTGICYLFINQIVSAIYTDVTAFEYAV